MEIRDGGNAASSILHQLLGELSRVRPGVTKVWTELSVKMTDTPLLLVLRLKHLIAYQHYIDGGGSLSDTSGYRVLVSDVITLIVSFVYESVILLPRAPPMVSPSPLDYRLGNHHVACRDCLNVV